MTFCLAVVTDRWGLVASDTRVRWREYDADEPRDLATLPITRVVDGGVKLVRLADGWLASGPYLSWRDGLTRALEGARGLAELTAAARAFGAGAMPQLEHESSAEARDVRQRQTTLFVIRDLDGYAGAALDWAGQPLWPGADCRTVSALCPDVPVETMRELLQAYQARVGRERDVGRVVRATAALFAQVCALGGPGGSVSGDVAIGLLEPRGQRLIGPLPHGTLLSQEVAC